MRDVNMNKEMKRVLVLHTIPEGQTEEYKTHGSEEKVGIIFMRRMQVLIERDSRSPHEAQKP